MLSQKQLLANRRNAQLSTGPRTIEGKSISSRNAVKHGLRAESIVIWGEDAEDFDQFRDMMLQDLSPMGALEVMLTDRIVAGFWKLRRAGRIETEILDGLQNESIRQRRRLHQKQENEIKRLQMEQLIQQHHLSPEQPSDYEKTRAAWAASEQAKIIRENRWPKGPGHPTPDEAMKDFIADYTLKLRRERLDKLNAQLQTTEASEAQAEPDPVQGSTAQNDCPPVSLGRIVQDDIVGSNILARFRLYEGQIERSLYKALTELQKLQVLRANLWMSDAPEPPADRPVQSDGRTELQGEPRTADS